MYGKIVTWLYKKHAEKTMKQAQKLNEKRKDAERQQVLEQMRQLYSFVQFLNRQFVNRKEKKSFWLSVAKNENVMENTIKKLIKRMKESKNDKNA